jgi:hypothetical protein
MIRVRDSAVGSGRMLAKARKWNRLNGVTGGVVASLKRTPKKERLASPGEVVEPSWGTDSKAEILAQAARLEGRIDQSTQLIESSNRLLDHSRKLIRQGTLRERRA